MSIVSKAGPESSGVGFIFSSRKAFKYFVRGLVNGLTYKKLDYR